MGSKNTFVNSLLLYGDASVNFIVIVIKMDILQHEIKRYITRVSARISKYLSILSTISCKFFFTLKITRKQSHLLKLI